MNIPEVGIPCKLTRTGKIIQFLLLGGLCLFVFNVTQNTCAFGLILLVYLIPSGLVASPDFTIYEEGIEIDFIFFSKRFIKWENISTVKKTSVNMRLYSKKLTVFNYLSGWGKAIILTPLWRTNYKAMVDILQQKLPDKFVETI